ncbi:MAG: hypothetical protein DMF63_05680 [Acidobacteria bacterium]|nr:MAG: hypothetical protein DMF63_05680 [Acidobacteriota bacterium]
MVDRDNFAEVLGSKFTLKASGEQSVDIELTEVSALKERPGNSSFSLIFTVPESYRVEQGLFDLEHSTLGAMQLFLVPVGIKKARQELQAIFNFALEEENPANASGD